MQRRRERRFRAFSANPSPLLTLVQNMATAPSPGLSTRLPWASDAFPEDCGEAWLEFLDQGIGGRQFSRGSGRLFGGTVYGREIDIDAAEVLDLCERWLSAVKPRLQQRVRF